ncbi:MAG: VOC family protein [Deltaproteobacteria bacterium]|nr:VOC family protein [Deltaproteobacteria bacterium]
MAIHYKHDNIPTICPALPGGAKLIAFMQSVFDAKVQNRYDAGPDMVAHAEIRLGDSVVMTGDPMGDHVLTPGAVACYVPEVDATYKKALEAGAESKEEPKNQFYGDRSARVVDPFGNTWSIATRVEELTKEEIDKRMAAMSG